MNCEWRIDNGEFKIGENTVLDQLQSSDFTPYLNDKFLLYIDAASPSEAELIQVTELGAAAPSGKRRPFSIVLRGPRDRRLPQMIYKIHHEKLGTVEIFLVPIGVDDKGYQYEAVFN